jgi:hypothetical protein
MKLGLASALAAMLGANAALAADAQTLRLYAALAKLEANKAETAGALLLAAIPGHSDEVYAEALEDWESDVAQIQGYIDALGEMEMTDAQRAGVDEFAAGWAVAVETGTPIIENYEDTPEYRARVFAWWESLDGLDDAVDDMMEDILKEHGVGFED